MQIGFPEFTLLLGLVVYGILLWLAWKFYRAPWRASAKNPVRSRRCSVCVCRPRNDPASAPLNRYYRTVWARSDRSLPKYSSRNCRLLSRSPRPT
jgi:hypothetical protein